MPALNFQARFVPLIESGAKTHSIRAMRKRPFRVGDYLRCRLIMKRTVTAARELRIGGRGVISVDGDVLSAGEMEELAVRDGFTGHADMMRFWEGRLPFLGQIVFWKFDEVTP